MISNEKRPAAAPERPNPIGPEPSPYWPRHLFNLFLRPTDFFKGQLALGKTPNIIIAAWTLGMSGIIDRIDTQIMKAELSDNQTKWNILHLLLDNWLNMWGIVLISGAVTGYFYWLIGGWWCQLRLKWSGAPSPDARLARLLIIYSSFVYSAPAVLVLLAQTFMYSNYLEAYSSDHPITFAVLLTLFWSVVTTYKGATALFPVKRGKALLWFVILPILFFLFLVGGFGFLYAVLGKQ